MYVPGVLVVIGARLLEPACRLRGDFFCLPAARRPREYLKTLAPPGGGVFRGFVDAALNRYMRSYIHVFRVSPKMIFVL